MVARRQGPFVVVDARRPSEMPLVSVVIPVYNGAATIAEAIASVLAQNFRDFELIVVDDGSTDPTPQVLAHYSGSLRVITQPNRGIAAARNAALRVSSGELVALLDGDDVWEPTMLTRTVEALDRDPSSVMAFTNLALTDSDGIALDTALIGPAMAHPPTLDEMLTRLWPIMPSAVVIRRQALEAIGGFNEEFRSYGFEDAYCWLRLRELGSFAYVPERLVRWRFASFPNPLKRVRPNPAAQATFARLVRDRWGRDVQPLLNSRRRASRSILGYIGLTALRRGDARVARKAFRSALAIDPWRWKNYLRLLRTFLPTSMATALGGRTTQNVASKKPHKSEEAADRRFG
jgi:glycosyltransferase involved in cell wall biosynthesis